MVTLTWSLSLLLNNSHVLKKAYDELDIHVGKDRHNGRIGHKKISLLPSHCEGNTTPIRLYPPGPIIGLRSAMEDCTLSAGHHIPAGTRLMVNVWKIQRDEHVWTDAHEFRPKRFLTSHKETDVRGQTFELIPFGSGRRSFPGISPTLQVVHLTLASVLHSFEFAKPSSEYVDMTESTGLTNLKATPLEVLLTLRLNSALYE